jgi:hypothetical protein
MADTSLGTCSSKTLLSLPPDLYAAARQVAAAEDRSFNNLVRYLLGRYIEAVETRERNERQIIEVLEERERKTA